MKNKFLPLLCAASLAMPLLASAQSLWHDDVSKPMFADKRANSVGDILTIVVQESSSANKNNDSVSGERRGIQPVAESDLKRS
jgi:flagellar basal body L-ring protein FlgH